LPSAQIEELSMARASSRLPERFPVGSKYVVESHGRVVSRYVEFPNGRRVVLAKRTALPCTQASARGQSRAHSRGHSHRPSISA
jgi:hypothetical protein